MKGRAKLALFLLLVIGVPLAGANGSPAATLVEAEGRVELLPPGSAPGEVRSAAAGTAILPGGTVRVGPGSRAELVLEAGSRIEISPDTEFVIEPDPASLGSGGNSLVLILGRILFRAVPLSRGGPPYRVVTPSSVCGLRGTGFTVAVARDGASRIGVEEGEVEVRGKEGTVLVSRGRETVVEIGQRPRNPIPAVVRNIDWERWLRERNERVRRRAEPVLAALAGSARSIDGQVDEFQDRLREVEHAVRDLARRAGDAVDAGDWGRYREIRNTMAETLAGGFDLARLAGEAAEVREASLRLGEAVAALSSAGTGDKKTAGIARELQSIRSSVSDGLSAEKDALNERVRSFRNIVEEHGLRTRMALTERGIDREMLERWRKLSREEKEELREKYQRWKSMSAERRREILDNWERFEKMSRKQRRQVVKNLREFQRMDPSERRIVRERYQRWKQLPPDRREEIKRRFRRFQQLSPREREEVLRRLKGSTSPPGPPHPPPGR